MINFKANTRRIGSNLKESALRSVLHVDNHGVQAAIAAKPCPLKRDSRSHPSKRPCLSCALSDDHGSLGTYSWTTSGASRSAKRRLLAFDEAIQNAANITPVRAVAVADLFGE